MNSKEPFGFRGSREEIKERLKIYLPWLEQTAVVCAGAPVLDLGCGRRPLQLLSEHRFTARGVDSNASMITRRKALGLEVVQTDAVAYLQSLPDQSLGAITSFHMIEHLPFEAIMAIMDEALRVLKSGGLLILETPIVDNVFVGAQSFWIDPTHIRPIVSETLRLFIEARGFGEVQLLDLQPDPEADRLTEGDGLAQWVNRNFFGPRDYSIVARRP